MVFILKNVRMLLNKLIFAKRYYVLPITKKMNSKDIINNRYVLEKLLGRGAFAEVWLAYDRLTDVKRALKIYAPATGLADDGVEMLTHEFSIMANVTHQNLLTPKNFEIWDNRPFLVLQYCRLGNISKLAGQFTEQQAWQLLRDGASALACLHTLRPPILHQDIKPANILLADNGLFMLTDFGVSMKARSTLSQSTGSNNLFSAGTLPYMAPERFSEQNMPIMANDIYSLGVTVFEMLTGYLPFGEHGGLLQKNGADVPALPEGQFSQQLSDVIAQCLQKEPSSRPFAHELEQIAQKGLDSTSQPTERRENRREKPQPPQKPTSQEKSKTWLWTIIGVAAIASMIVAALLLWNDTTEEAILPPDTNPVTTDSVKPFVNDSITPHDSDGVVNIKTTDRQTTVTNVEVKAQRQTIDLGYATYTGEVKNGKPHGEGTLTFKVPHRLDSHDDDRNIAEAGDRLEGSFYQGHLDYGTWHKQDGSTQTLVFGH